MMVLSQVTSRSSLDLDQTAGSFVDLRPLFVGSRSFLRMPVHPAWFFSGASSGSHGGDKKYCYIL